MLCVIYSLNTWPGLRIHHYYSQSICLQCNKTFQKEFCVDKWINKNISQMQLISTFCNGQWYFFNKYQRNSKMNTGYVVLVFFYIFFISLLFLFLSSSCVPYVVSFSELSIIDCPLGNLYSLFVSNIRKATNIMKTH